MFYSHVRQDGSAEQASEEIFSGSDLTSATEPPNSTLETKVHLPSYYQHFHGK
jgi:hypothetical protein